MNKKILTILTMLIVYIGFTSCKESSVSPEENPLTSLVGTKWKLIRIGNLTKETLREAEPKVCEKCYVLNFDTDSSVSGFTSNNTLAAKYTIDYTNNTLHFNNICVTKAGEFGDGLLYLENFENITKFYASPSALKLYFDNENQYFLYKSISG